MAGSLVQGAIGAGALLFSPVGSSPAMLAQFFSEHLGKDGNLYKSTHIFLSALYLPHGRPLSNLLNACWIFSSQKRKALTGSEGESGLPCIGSLRSSAPPTHFDNSHAMPHDAGKPQLFLPSGFCSISFIAMELAQVDTVLLTTHQSLHSPLCEDV